MPVAENLLKGAQNDIAVAAEYLCMVKHLGNEMEFLAHMQQISDQVDLQKVYDDLLNGRVDEKTFLTLKDLDQSERKILLVAVDALVNVSNRVGVCKEVQSLMMHMLEMHPMVQKRKISEWKEQKQCL